MLLLFHSFKCKALGNILQSYHYSSFITVTTVQKIHRFSASGQRAGVYCRCGKFMRSAGMPYIFYWRDSVAPFWASIKNQWFRLISEETEASCWKSDLFSILAFLSVTLLLRKALISSGVPSGLSLAVDIRRPVFLPKPGFTEGQSGMEPFGLSKESFKRSDNNMTNKEKFSHQHIFYDWICEEHYRKGICKSNL